MEFTWLKVPQWEEYETLLHGFMGRRGGKSVGPYAGLNISYRVGDDAKIVSQNVCDMKQAVRIHDGRIITMKQIHGERTRAAPRLRARESSKRGLSGDRTTSTCGKFASTQSPHASGQE